MRYWLIKSEPDAWSWDQQLAQGTGAWTGVRNFQAANNLKAMKVGDQAFFYHSNIGKEIIGTVEVTAEAYPDPTDKPGRFVSVDVRALEAMKAPVTLAVIKQDSALAEMTLLKLSRLSVQPVTAAQWRHICKLGGINPAASS